MQKRLSKPASTFNAPRMEQAVLRQWRTEDTFARSLAQTKGGQRFTFYDGPPFATGLPHYGHLLQGALKDIIPRFKTMQGYHVSRRFGWDCHGLPVEYELEKERGITSRQEILDMGVDVFNEACRSIVLRHTKEWQRVTTRLGRWVDFANDYKTMDPDYMESVWWVVKSLWQKQLLTEGRKSMHICPRCATTLSNFEVTLGYRDRQDPAVTVRFPLATDPQTTLLAWTTTPWTLPGNVLLAINPDIEYVAVAHQGKNLIMAKSRLAAVLGEAPKQTTTVSASRLLGQAYLPPFPVEGLPGPHYQVVADHSVTAEEGTGILHVAPAFGEDDLRIAEREGAPLIQHITMSGYFTDPFPRYHDRTALEANPEIISELQRADRLVAHETINHSYPHCWRCDTPLLNYATTQWFVAVPKLKQRLLAENKKIAWTPPHVRDGRFGMWLAGARDWAISRQRFWGNPLPIWRCSDDSSHVVVIGSRDELAELSGQRPNDLHKHIIDQITFPCPDCHADMRRVEDVLDCWFESGSMPYAEAHYPFQHADRFSERFPADFIAEALDQTRGWFYTLHVLGVALMDSRAFSNVITTGLVLAEDGKKMSKSLKNYPEPEHVFDQYGADALRLYMVSSPIVRGDDLRFSERGVAETLRTYILTLWNTFSFLTTYAAVDRWQITSPPKRPHHLLDRWILSRLDSVTAATTDSLEHYDVVAASRALTEFVDELSNWYVRRSRRRFWKSQDDTDKSEAYATLYHVVSTLCRLTAPFTPFIADHLYRQLNDNHSVHLAAWPKPAGYHDQSLENAMAVAREAVRLGLAARTTAACRVRQPLREARIVDQTSHRIVKNKEIVQIIAEELNVKQVAITSQHDDFAEIMATPNPRVIGPVAGKQSQAVIDAFKSGAYRTTPTGFMAAKVALPPEAAEISYRPGGHFTVASSRRMVVGLDTQLDDALRQEGLARELIRAVQELRKQANFDVADRITLALQTTDTDLQQAVTTHHDLISEEVLARSLEFAERLGDTAKSVTLNGHRAAIRVRKAR